MPRRRRNRPRFAFSAVLLAFASASAPAYAWHYMTPEFLAKTARPMSLAVLPPHADFIKQQAIMTAELLKEAQALEDEAATALGVQLRSLGYAVRVVTPKEVADTPGLGALLTALDARYDEEWAKILRKKREVKRSRYSAGDDVVKVSSLLNVDGLIMSRVVAVGHTKGSQWLTLVLSAGTDVTDSYARISLGVLEGKTGRVQGYFEGKRSSSLHGMLKKPAHVMNRLVKNAINPYPGSNDVEIVDDASAAGPKEAAKEDKSDEEAISDFETVLKGRSAGVPPAPGVSPAPQAPQAAPETTPAVPAPSPAPGLTGAREILRDF